MISSAFMWSISLKIPHTKDALENIKMLHLVELDRNRKEIIVSKHYLIFVEFIANKDMRIPFRCKKILLK